MNILDIVREATADVAQEVIILPFGQAVEIISQWSKLSVGPVPEGGIGWTDYHATDDMTGTVRGQAVLEWEEYGTDWAHIDAEKELRRAIRVWLARNDII
jgi:hypothetical protein